jgi:general nucleoside transport system ATP-binding protein
MTDALALEAINIRKRFGDVVALGGVSLKVREGSVHALLGENGAGKSTLVKCLTGYYTPDEGQFIVAGRQLVNRSPREALRAGIGMVYQHFTLVPGMTVAENLLLARSAIPFAIGWREFQREIESRLASMPFRVPLQAQVSSLSAGEKQKVEILKQLLMNRRLLVLDEPSSVLTPQESDDVLGALSRQAKSGALTVVLITHKLREVRQFADDVTVLRHGSVAGGGPAGALSDPRLAELMVGAPQETAATKPRARAATSGARLRIAELRVRSANGAVAVDGVSLSIASGETLGIVGISGNGQRELVEALAGQRAFEAGNASIDGEPFARNRAFMRRHRIAVLPEEPLRNACVAEMSVSENLAMRAYDEAPLALGGRLARWRMRPDRLAAWARGVIQRNAIHAGGPESAVSTLSGGNVQRLVLAREIGERGVGLLIAANPCFGLDFAAAARIRDRIRAVRDSGAAVLFISEDLDEVFDIADRIAVMSSGRIVYQTARAGASRNAIGQAMAGAAVLAS